MEIKQNSSYLEIKLSSQRNLLKSYGQVLKFQTIFLKICDFALLNKV